MDSKKNYFYSISLGISIFWLIITHFQNEVPPDTGDGIMHFFMSQASWENPTLFLEHWGKPFFILLSSPFAQFGFTGLIVFQVLVHFFICFFGFKIAKQLEISTNISFLFPILLVLTYEYSSTILGGLTEPLFNLFCIISCYFLLKENWFSFALVIAFTPFLRSEGQFCIVLGVLFLIYEKKLNYLPILFSVFIIYSCIGYFVFHDFWWYFTKSPYQLSNDIYGKGSFFHYFLAYKSFIGNHGFVLFLLAVFAFFINKLYLKWKEKEWKFVLFSNGIFFVILFAHSYFYATGQNGSIGLTRIATQGMPLFLLSNFFLINSIEISFLKKNKFLISSSILVLLGIILFSTKTWPKKADAFEKHIIHAANFIEKNTIKNVNLFYHHPLFSFALKQNPFLQNTNTKMYYGNHLEDDLNHIIKKGDFLIWDSHFGPVEAGMPLEKVISLKELTLVKKFSSTNKNAKINAVYVFQNQDTNVK
jgi:hypothetical protein